MKVQVIPTTGDIDKEAAEVASRMLNWHYEKVVQLKQMLEYLSPCAKMYPHTKELARKIAKDAKRHRIKYGIYECF